MITFWTNDTGRAHFDRFLRTRAVSTFPKIEVARYEDLQPRQSLAAKTHIFAALDQLCESQVEAVESLWRQLEALPGVRLLNHPRKVLHRYELLRALAERELNRFRAWRPADDLSGVRFPVFIREARRHTGAWPLLHDREELNRAVRALVARGFRRDELLVVEFCDTVDSAGHYRKYGAMKIGDRILPWHMMIGRKWMLKGESNLRTPAAAREQLAYLRDNPHESWLREVFRIAGIDYGRVDYGLVGDTPQIWEINLDPSLGSGRNRRSDDPEYERLNAERREMALRAMSEALGALDAGPPPAEALVVLTPGVLRRIRNQTTRQRWRKNALALGQWCAGRPLLGRALRWTYEKLFPRPTAFRMP
jgi:hypothetical protein